MAQEHALIIGGTKGAGRVAVRLFRDDGYFVSVIARRIPQSFAKRVSLVRYWGVDILDENAVRRSLQEILTTRGKITALIFFQRFRGNGDSWANEIDTSLTATKRLIEMLVDEFGLHNCAIIIVSSVNSYYISRSLSLGYHVAKAGMNQMVRYYAVTLATRGIRVNSVSPGTFLKEESKGEFLKNKALMKLYQKMIPIGRMCVAEEVVWPIMFLCSGKASFITGQDLIVDGGLALQFQEALGRELAVK